MGPNLPTINDLWYRFLSGSVVSGGTLPSNAGIQAVGAQYNSTAPTETSGGLYPVQADQQGNLKVYLASKLAGEDLTADVLKVEQRFTYATITTATTTTIKTGSGYVQSVTILGGTLGAITVYDNTAASGTAICPTFTPTSTLPAPSIDLNCSFSTGLTIVTAAATIIQVTYR